MIACLKQFLIRLMLLALTTSPSLCDVNQLDSQNISTILTKVGRCRTTIHSEVQASIDQTETIVEEYSSISLRYRTPYFRATAVVTMPPITRKETWTVGWIQACDHMEFINQYGNLGSSSWEFPALKSGKIPAVSDSDCVSYPWYGSTTQIATIVGPTDSFKNKTVSMNDNFYPSVSWDIPVSEGTKAHLTSIVRNQSFVTWLAAINETTKEIIVLKTVRWKFYLKIDIDPLQTLGSRARVVAPQFQEQPTVSSGSYEQRFYGSRAGEKVEGTGNNNSYSNYVGQIPMSALVRPCANNAQTLIWRPTRHSSQVVVPAKESYKAQNELVRFNAGVPNQGCSQNSTSAGARAGLSKTSQYTTSAGARAGLSKTSQYTTSADARAGLSKTSQYTTSAGARAGLSKTSQYTTSAGARAGLSKTSQYTTSADARAGLSKTSQYTTSADARAGLSKTSQYTTSAGARVGLSKILFVLFFFWRLEIVGDM